MASRARRERVRPVETVVWGSFPERRMNCAIGYRSRFRAPVSRRAAAGENGPNERNSQSVSRIRFATTGIPHRRSTHVSLVFCPLLWNIRNVTERFPCFSAHECRRLVEYVRERDKIRQRVVRHGGRKHLLACLK